MPGHVKHSDSHPGTAGHPLPQVLPESSHYHTARRAWDVHVDQRPAAVCVATRVEHVQAALGYVRAHGLRVAAQTTGHLAQPLPDLRDTLLLRSKILAGDQSDTPTYARNPRDMSNMNTTVPTIRAGLKAPGVSVGEART